MSDDRDMMSDSRFMKDDGDKGGFRGKNPKFFYKKKVCRVCNNTVKLDYKEPEVLRKFITERGKILPRRITGTCAKHQRALAVEIKKSRILALLPFVVK